MEKEVFYIGSDPTNDLVIGDDDYVSGQHAYVHYDRGNLLLADQRSRNGTFLNEKRLTHAASALKPGDRIRLGTTTLEVVQALSR